MAKTAASRAHLAAAEKVDYSEFYELLLKRRNELLSKNARDRAQIDQMQATAGPGDEADLSVVDEHSDFFLQMADRDRAELLEVRRALAKIHQGTYGKCEECGAEIAAGRLRMQPQARLCVEDQRANEARERAHRTFPHPKF